MKFAVLLMASIASAAPTNQLVVTSNYYPDNHTIYTSDHDIVDIVVPLNRINYRETSYNYGPFIFFVTADIKNGKKDYKGLYVFKNSLAKRLLDDGQCATYAKDKNAYFGAKDGIYKYDDVYKTANKYGTVTDSVIKMAFDAKNSRVYYITEDYVLHKYNENEIAISNVDAVQDARDIVFDFNGNMFYYDGKKQFFSYNGDRVVKIEGLPSNPTEVDLVRSPIVLNQVYAVVDGSLYEINANGTTQKTPVTFQAKPTAFAPDYFIFQYYGYKKTIYEYNLAALDIEELNKFLENKKDQLNALKAKLPPTEPKRY